MISAVFTFCAKNNPSIAHTVGACWLIVSRKVRVMATKHSLRLHLAGHLIVP